MLVFILLLASCIVFAVEAFLTRSLLAIGLLLGFAAFLVGAWPG